MGVHTSRRIPADDVPKSLTVSSYRGGCKSPWEDLHHDACSQRGEGNEIQRSWPYSRGESLSSTAEAMNVFIFVLNFCFVWWYDFLLVEFVVEKFKDSWPLNTF